MQSFRRVRCYRARSAIGSGGPRLIFYTHALFIVPPLHIMPVFEHFTRARAPVVSFFVAPLESDPF